MERYTKKMAVCKPGRELSAEPDHADTLIWDSQAPELRNNHLLFEPPVCGLCYSCQIIFMISCAQSQQVLGK